MRSSLVGAYRGLLWHAYVCIVDVIINTLIYKRKPKSSYTNNQT